MDGYNRGVVGDTLITMWDLSQKPISQLEVLDEILAYDESYVGQRNEKPNLGVWVLMVHIQVIMNI